ncbi:MAG: hypothetical protein HQ518_18760 [Rhodopirellula sp.]|nr:hypothetical protein [Rhodopirellula sp.]
MAASVTRILFAEVTQHDLAEFEESEVFARRVGNDAEVAGSMLWQGSEWIAQNCNGIGITLQLPANDFVLRTTV